MVKAQQLTNNLTNTSTYSFSDEFTTSPLNNHRFHELKFLPVFGYEKELGLSIEQKIDMILKVIEYFEERNIHITFTDRIIDDLKPWEKEEGQEWRYVPIAELQGNNICVNPRNIDFMSVFLSIGHIYGHLVQRMNYSKYKPITDLLEVPKPMDLEKLFSEYTTRYGTDYKSDFLAFEQEAFRYAKYSFIEAGVEWNDLIEYAMNVYIEADFNELWRWVTESPNKTGDSFMEEFQKLWFKEDRTRYGNLAPKPVDIEVIPEREGSLIVVRNGMENYGE